MTDSYSVADECLGFLFSKSGNYISGASGVAIIVTLCVIVPGRGLMLWVGAGCYAGCWYADGRWCILRRALMVRRTR